MIATDSVDSSAIKSFFMFLYCAILLFFCGTSVTVADLIAMCYDKSFALLKKMKTNLSTDNDMFN
jgi:hypothetical protein